MTPNASEQGKFGSFGAILGIHIFALHVGVGVSKKSLEVGSWQNAFFLADFYFWAAGFFSRILSPIFCPHFCGGKKCPENPPEKSPAKFIQHKSPTHICRGAGPNMMRYLDGPTRAHRFADSHQSPDSRESFQGSRTEPSFCANRASGGKKGNRRFDSIGANRSHVV